MWPSPSDSFHYPSVQKGKVQRFMPKFGLWTASQLKNKQPPRAWLTDGNSQMSLGVLINTQE